VQNHHHLHIPRNNDSLSIRIHRQPNRRHKKRLQKDNNLQDLSQIPQREEVPHTRPMVAHLRTHPQATHRIRPLLLHTRQIHSSNRHQQQNRISALSIRKIATTHPVRHSDDVMIVGEHKWFVGCFSGL